MPLASRRGLSLSDEDLTTTHEATGRRVAVSGGSSNVILRFAQVRSCFRGRCTSKAEDALGRVVVVRLYGLELEVDEVLGVEGALVRDFRLEGGDGLGSAVEIDVPREASHTCESECYSKDAAHTTERETNLRQ